MKLWKRKISLKSIKSFVAKPLNATVVNERYFNFFLEMYQRSLNFP